MGIGGVLFDCHGVRIQDVLVTLREPTPGPGRTSAWAGTFDLEPHVAAVLMHQGSSLLLRLSDGREGWCSVSSVDFEPGAPVGFHGTGSLEVPTVVRDAG